MQLCIMNAGAQVRPLPAKFHPPKTKVSGTKIYSSFSFGTTKVFIYLCIQHAGKSFCAHFLIIIA